MASTVASVVFHIVIVFLSLKFYPAKANLIRAGYWDLTDDITSSDLDATLFTHLICHAAGINSTSYQVSLSPFGAKRYSNFQEFVKQKIPSVTTLLSIGGKYVNDVTFSSMLNDSSYRKSFIDSSINLARDYGFQGLDFFWQFPNASSGEMSSLGMLFQEWRVAAELEAQKSNQSRLILTSRVGFSPQTASGTYPVKFIQQNLDWVHFFYGGFRNLSSKNTTAAPVSLFDPSSTVLYTDYGIKEWLKGGLSANKFVLHLPFYGYWWNLANPEDSGLGKTATGPARSIKYKEIKSLINNHGSKVDVMYNSTYGVNYCLIGSRWIAFDDVESIKAKISYAKEKSLLGYHVWMVSYDVNWVLSQAAGKQLMHRVFSSK